eukprot:g2380.t1
MDVLFRWCVTDIAERRGPQLPPINPVPWAVGHVGHFLVANAARWLVAAKPGDAAADDAARLRFDSMVVAHADRWAVEGGQSYYAAAVKELRAAVLAAGESARTTYLVLYAVVHTFWHLEDILKTRQLLRYPPPPELVAGQEAEGAAGAGLEAGLGAAEGLEVLAPGCAAFQLGALGTEELVFDSDKGVHAVRVAPFAIDRCAVSNAQFARFVNAGGYRNQRFWDVQGWAWRVAAGAERPLYWERCAGGGGVWAARWFDRVEPLPAAHPVMHINWHEARAYCRWRGGGRRLPTEAEWEFAAAFDPRAPERKRVRPWGDASPSAARCRCLGAGLGDAAGPGGAGSGDALPAGDSAMGCRQMLGNVWEWTASPFDSFPGFEPDVPYREQSAPWLGRHNRKVLRGGSWATTALLARTTYRNFQPAEDREWFAGFRTCRSCVDAGSATAGPPSPGPRGRGEPGEQREEDGAQAAKRQKADA